MTLIRPSKFKRTEKEIYRVICYLVNDSFLNKIAYEKQKKEYLKHCNRNFYFKYSHGTIEMISGFIRLSK